MGKKGNVARFLAGAAVGAGLGILFAPKSGKETRADLKKKFDELVEKAKEIDIDEVKENILLKIDEIQEELKSLDKEKVLKIAKEKARAIEAKTEELVKLAVDSAKPKLEAMANDVKKSTVKTLKNIIAKLEETDKPQPKISTKTKAKKA